MMMMQRGLTHLHGTPRDVTHLHATPRDVTHLHGTPRDVMHLHETPCDVTHLHGTPRDVTHLHGTPREVTHLHGTPRDVTHPHGTPRDVTHLHGTPLDVTHLHGTPHDVTHLHGTPRDVTHLHMTPRDIAHLHGTPREVTHLHMTPRDIAHLHGTPPGTSEADSVTISAAYSCSVCEFQCLRLPLVEQHIMKEHCNIHPFGCKTCTISCKIHEDAVQHLTAPPAGHAQTPVIEERTEERWNQFKVVLNSFKVYVTIRCSIDVSFHCRFCRHSTSNIETAMRHLICCHGFSSRRDAKGSCDICTYYDLTRVGTVGQLKEFSTSMPDVSHTIGFCLLSAWTISRNPVGRPQPVRSHMINYSEMVIPLNPRMNSTSVHAREHPWYPPAQVLHPERYPGSLNTSKWFSPPTRITNGIHPNDILRPNACSLFRSHPHRPSPTERTVSVTAPPSLEIAPPARRFKDQLRILSVDECLAREQKLWREQQVIKSLEKRMTMVDPSRKRDANVVTSSSDFFVTSGCGEGEPPTKRFRSPRKPVVVIDLTETEDDEYLCGQDPVVLNSFSHTNNNTTSMHGCKTPQNSIPKVPLLPSLNPPLHPEAEHQDIFLDTDESLLGNLPDDEEEDKETEILDLSMRSPGSNQSATTTSSVPVCSSGDEGTSND